jgi:hypothetical protein
MYHYAHALRRSHFIMVNSSWTKNHVDSILQHKDTLLDYLHLLSPLALLDMFYPLSPPSVSRIVYPPCDTHEMVNFPLGPRERVILSIAQFRYAPLGSYSHIVYLMSCLQGLKRTTKHKWKRLQSCSKHILNTETTRR